ncbi:MAG: signal recognition particle protein [Candidatus Acetothermia bacterium]|jgi:signal recognition particle subunit SRP54|nr:signal recognition particle protein [Candidatus Acetothermia bacterium]MDH7504828.1 signal recognition particle protein [Candidatus Acetothermia bacterium]
MFDSLGQRLTEVLTRLRRKGRLTRADVEEGLREVRRVLLEADVNYKVAKSFTERVAAKALGQEILESLTPGQQVIKLIHDELAALMGGGRAELDLSPGEACLPSVVMLVGLQGSGKTTTAGKLARYLVKRGQAKRPLLVAADVYRPAAGEQLRQLSERLGFAYFGDGSLSPLEIARQALERARAEGFDLVVLDTAGRLQVDEPLMAELEAQARALEPREVLLVADAMTGQEAVAIAGEFHRRLKLTGIILTKLDGDARGGAALSMVEVTGVPIKFVGVGERLEDLEPFYPERMAGRILGMGDVLSLIEEAEERLDQKRAEELAERLVKEEFTLQDFLDQLRQVRRMGPLERLLEKLPGAGRVQVEDKELDKVEAIINSMTRAERLNPQIIDGSRKRRIARGSGTAVSEVNRLLKRFNEARRMMKRLGKLSKRGELPLEGLPF